MRDNHYESAFEGWLRSRQVPYVAVDEARRSLVADGSLKSLDFIVSPPQPFSWLVDVKGRRFPSGDEQKQYWKNWSPREDLRCLARWEELFGPGFQGLFVFAYHLTADRSPVPVEQLFEFRGEQYAFIGVTLRDYAPHARQISSAWDTVALPTATFRQLARPIESFFLPANVPAPVAAAVSAPTPLDPDALAWLEAEPEE